MATLIPVSQLLMNGSEQPCSVYINSSKIKSIHSSTFNYQGAVVVGSSVVYDICTIYCNNTASYIQSLTDDAVSEEVFLSLTTLEGVAISLISNEIRFVSTTSKGVSVVTDNNQFFVSDTLSSIVSAINSVVPVKSGSGAYSIQTKEPNGANASGIASVAYHTGIASGNHGMAWGEINESQGENSTAFGVQSVAIGNDSCAQGVGCQSIGQGSHAQGEATESTGMASFSTGRQSNSYYDHSQAYSSGALGQTISVALMGQSTSTTPVNLSLAYGDTPTELDLTVANDPLLWDMYVKVTGVNTATGAYFTKLLKTTYSKTLGTVTTIEIGSQVSSAMSACAVTISKAGTVIRIACTGLSATNITWYAMLDINEIH